MENGTILFVSHDTSSVRALCNHAIWLDKGSIKKTGNPKSVSESYLEAYYDSQQGDVSLKVDQAKINQAIISLKDLRQDFINQTNFRNDLELFTFKSDAASFGAGGATIFSVHFYNTDGKPLSWAVGGEDVLLRIEIKAKTHLNSPIVGFFVKDKLGQCLFGDNTYLSTLNDPVNCSNGEVVIVDFRFNMPRLPIGNYSITVAIADGSQAEHVQHHWIHDAITFRSESTSVSSGLIGIPMQGIAIRTKV